MKAKKPIGAIAVTSKAVFNLPCTGALLQQACTWSKALLVCICVGLLQRLYEGQKTHRCNCSDKQGCFQLALHRSTAAAGIYKIVGFVAVHVCWVTAEAV